MRRLLPLVFCGCTVSTQLPPEVTCPGMQLVSDNSGGCNLETQQQCSDGRFYSIDCQDDGTCTCVLDQNVVNSILVTEQPSGYCANLAVSQLNDLSIKCGWNLQP